MNSITRLILRHVVSGNVELTPRLLHVLQSLEQDQLDAGTPTNLANSSSTLPAKSKVEPPANEKHLTFVNPLPGRWIRRTECTVGIALLLAVSLAQAALDPAHMDAANHDFAQGKYSEAARGYESIIQNQGYSAPVLFNLANALQRAGEVGKAILNYERAALLAPNDPDITANLQVARQKAGVEPEPSSPIQLAAHTLTANLWFGLAMTSLCLFAAALTLKFLRPKAHRVAIIGGVPAVVALLVAAGALVLRSTDLRRAVVTASEAVAGVSPVTAAASVFKLRAGEIVTLERTHGAFALIHNQAGHAGWVKSGEIERVIPATAAGPLKPPGKL